MPLRLDEIVPDFVARFGGVPATSRSRAEAVVRYRTGAGSGLPVVLGLYGDGSRVRSWLPGYPRRVDRSAAAALVADIRPPVATASAATVAVGLSELPVLRTTPRDAGPYITLGMVSARDGRGGIAMSVHRLLVLDDHRLAIWMVPGRRLAQLHQRAVQAGEHLPVAISIGAPPAAVIASALGTRFLPEGVDKVDVAGALAGAPIGVHEVDGSPALADSEVVLRGHLGADTADETTTGELGTSLPEFLGTDGAAQPALPVITVTSGARRSDALYQAVAGPGREQSVILGLAGSLSVALSLTGPHAHLVRDVHFPAAGGGMSVAVLSVRKVSAADDAAPFALARSVAEAHPFTKLVVVMDDDVDPADPEDVLWALTTRSNLGSDCVTVSGLPAMPFDLSQGADWHAERGGTPAGRGLVDATVPYRLRGRAARSFDSDGGRTR